MRTLVLGLAVALALAGCSSTPAPQNGPSSSGGDETTPAATSSTTSPAAASVAKSLTYSCPVCKTVSDKPGQCPDCGGDMVAGQ
jgi:hypothetical protein